MGRRCSALSTISLTEDIIELPAYFKQLDYPVAPDFPVQFFSCYQAMSTIEKEQRHNLSDFEDIISVLLIKSQDQSDDFHDDFKSFVERRKIVSEQEAETIQKAQEKRSNRIANIESKVKKQKKQLNEVESELVEARKFKQDINIISEAKSRSIDKLMAKHHKKLSEIMGMSDDEVCGIYIDRPKSVEHLENTLDKLAAAADKAFLESDFKDLLNLIGKLIDVTQEWRKCLEKEKADGKRLYNLENRAKAIKKSINAHEKELADLTEQEQITTQAIKIKGKSLHHRDIFRGGGAVIQYDSDPVLNKNFSSLNNFDKEKIEEYLRVHAQQFRTHLTRNIHASAKRIIDMSATCKRACGTNGVPVRLEYVKPKRQKVQLIMFLDVSGSCKNASSAMLSFMKTVTEVFGGGVKSYCFVNSLYDISDMLYDGASVQSVLSQIPTKGVYSDYNKPMQQFVSEHMSEVNGDTIMLFIGDARNNKNANPEEMFKQVARRARSTYWMNTESRDKWDYKDSIISSFAKYTKRTEAIMTTNELIDFMMHVR